MKNKEIIKENEQLKKVVKQLKAKLKSKKTKDSRASTSKRKARGKLLSKLSAINTSQARTAASTRQFVFIATSAKHDWNWVYCYYYQLCNLQ